MFCFSLKDFSDSDVTLKLGQGHWKQYNYKEVELSSGALPASFEELDNHYSILLFTTLWAPQHPYI